MKTFFHSAALLAVLLSLASCYKPHGEYEANINPPDSAYAQIELNPNDSFLYVCEYTKLDYNLLLNGKKFLLAELYIGGELYKSQYNNPGYIIIDPHDFETGEYQIDLVMYCSTNSGSLADALGAEAFQYEFTWNALMDTSEPEAVDFTSVSIEDGRLKIEWEKNENLNFKYYKLTRKWYPNSHQDLYGKIFIKDQDVTSFVDSTYIGGFARYNIYVYTYGHEYGTYSESVEVDYPGPEPELTYDEDYNLIFSWKSCKLYNNIRKYSVCTSSPNSIIHETTNPFDTTYQEVGGISNPFYRGVIWHSDSASLPTGYIFDIDLFTAGISTGVYGSYRFFTNTQPPDLYFAELQDLFKLNSINHNIETSINNNRRFRDMFVSSNGDHLVQICSFDPLVRVFDTENLSHYRDYNINDLAANPSSMGEVAVSDNGLMLGLLYNNTVFGYDLNTKEQKFQIDVSANIENTHMDVSPSGNYFLLWDYADYSVKLFEITATGANLISNLGSNFRYAFFMKDGNENKVIAITTQGEVQIYTCEDQVMIHSFDTEAERMVNIDPVTGYLFTINTQNKLYLFYNIESGEKLKEIPYGNRVFYWPILVDSKLYTGAYCYPINI